MATKTARTGRPTKFASPGKKVSLGLKVTADIKDLLDSAARESGRTQSQEAELRLTNSFEGGPVAIQALALAYGPRTAALALVIARAMHETGTSVAFNKTFTLEGAANWVEDADAYAEATQAVETILKSARPPGERTVRNSFEGMLPADHPLRSASMGAGFANSLIAAVTGQGPTGELQKWGEPLREMLGSVAKRMTQAERQHAVVMDIITPKSSKRGPVK